MGTYRILLCVALFCGITSETNGYEFQQQPSTKWAFAQSYSWVISSNGNNNFDSLTQQSQEQARLQQQLLQQQEIRQGLHQQALQLQARQDQVDAMQKQATLDALQKQAVTQALQQQQVRNENIQFGSIQSQSNPIRSNIVPNESNGQLISNLQALPNLPSRNNAYTQEFIDEIVRKVIQESRGEFTLPTTRDDVERIVRKILSEYSSNNIREPNVNSSQMNRYLDNGQSANNNQNPHETNANRIGLSQTFHSQKPINYPVTTAAEPFSSQVECFFNCGNSQRDSQPIAVAMANLIYSLNRSTNPRMVANSYSYTSV